MPVPASDAIASDVGHGALGVRYGLRPFRDLLAETVGQRHLWAELRPKKVVEAPWNAYDTNPTTTWYKAIAETSDSIVLDIVGTKTLAETLGRVESVARCQAIAGTFFYNGTSLYVHLTDDADPAITTAVAELGIHLGSHGVYQPILLPDRLANGTLEAWTGTDPDGWTAHDGTTAGTIALDKTTDDPLQGSYAARFTFTAASGLRALHQTFTTHAPTVVYRVSGAYRVTCPTGLLRAGLIVYDTATAYLWPDGRSVGVANWVFADAPVVGEWRRFTYDFICPSWASLRVWLFAEVISGTQSGSVDFDDVKLQPISRHAYHEPLLSMDSLPTLEAARADAFWGSLSAAIGGLSIANGGGLWDALLAAYDWIGAQAVFRVGGRYQLGGNEVLMEDCPVIG